MFDVCDLTGCSTVSHREKSDLTIFVLSSLWYGSGVDVDSQVVSELYVYVFVCDHNSFE